MTAYDELAARWAAVMMPNYGVPALALVRGDGAMVWDADGRAYLDLIAGIAVSSLGHNHPRLVEAVRRQVGAIAHASNLVMHQPGIALAERLLALLGHDGRVFFANSGAEVNEAALKLVRRYGGTTRTRVVAAEHGFHGRTMGALALTGKAAIRDPFGPFGIDVSFVPYGDTDALCAAVDERTAAVFLEPALGEAGVVPPPPGYLRAARTICTDRAALLVLDEIQSGIGRTGRWYAHQHDDVVPDVLTLAKGLGGGLPIGACIGVGAAGALFRRGDHGSTFGGNPVACAAALAVLDTIDEDGLLAHVSTVGDRLAAGLAAVDHPLIRGVRGLGLWRAIVLSEPVAASVETAARRAGFLVNAVAADAIRLAPPLVVTSPQLDSFVAAVPAVLDATRVG